MNNSYYNYKRKNKSIFKYLHYIIIIINIIFNIIYCNFNSIFNIIIKINSYKCIFSFIIYIYIYYIYEYLGKK